MSPISVQYVPQIALSWHQLLQIQLSSCLAEEVLRTFEILNFRFICFRLPRFIPLVASVPQTRHKETRPAALRRARGVANNPRRVWGQGPGSGSHREGPQGRRHEEGPSSERPWRCAPSQHALILLVLIFIYFNDFFFFSFQEKQFFSFCWSYLKLNKKSQRESKVSEIGSSWFF